MNQLCCLFSIWNKSLIFCIFIGILQLPLNHSHSKTDPNSTTIMPIILSIWIPFKGIFKANTVEKIPNCKWYEAQDEQPLVQDNLAWCICNKNNWSHTPAARDVSETIIGKIVDALNCTKIDASVWSFYYICKRLIKFDGDLPKLSLLCASFDRGKTIIKAEFEYWLFYVLWFSTVAMMLSHKWQQLILSLWQHYRMSYWVHKV